MRVRHAERLSARSAAGADRLRAAGRRSGRASCGTGDHLAGHSLRRRSSRCLRAARGPKLALADRQRAARFRRRPRAIPLSRNSSPGSRSTCRPACGVTSSSSPACRKRDPSSPIRLPPELEQARTRGDGGAARRSRRTSRSRRSLPRRTRSSSSRAVTCAAFDAVCDVLEERLGAERAVLPGAGHSLSRAPGYNDALVSFVERPDDRDRAAADPPAYGRRTGRNSRALARSRKRTRSAGRVRGADARLGRERPLGCVGARDRRARRRLRPLLRRGTWRVGARVRLSPRSLGPRLRDRGRAACVRPRL